MQCDTCTKKKAVLFSICTVVLLSIILNIFEIFTPPELQTTTEKLQTELQTTTEKLQTETPPFSTFNTTTVSVPNCLSKPGLSHTPIILMSKGRSGSTVIWQMLSNLTKSPHQNKPHEYTGGNLESNLYFFDTTIPAETKFTMQKDNNDALASTLKISGAKLKDVPGKNNSEHGEWMIHYVCRLRRRSPGGLVGFQWKASIEQFVKRPEALESLQMLASMALSAKASNATAPIVIVRSRRNIVDQKLSGQRHKINKGGSAGLTAHCLVDDTDCIEIHNTKQFLTNVPQFYKKSLMQWKEENDLDDLLSSLSIPMVSVSYDTLFYPDRIIDGEDEWNRLIRAVVPSLPKVSWDDVQNSMEYAPTRPSRYHEDLIENWDEVLKKFQGTAIEHLLRKKA